MAEKHLNRFLVEEKLKISLATQIAYAAFPNYTKCYLGLEFPFIAEHLNLQYVIKRENKLDVPKEFELNVSVFLTALFSYNIITLLFPRVQISLRLRRHLNSEYLEDGKTISCPVVKKLLSLKIAQLGLNHLQIRFSFTFTNGSATKKSIATVMPFVEQMLRAGEKIVTNAALFHFQQVSRLESILTQKQPLEELHFCKMHNSC